MNRLELPTPFPVGPVNVYLAEGGPGPEEKGLILVDVGPRFPPALEALEQGLAGHGYTLQDVRCIIVTHAHADHFGLAAEVARRSGAQVWTHPRSRPWLEDYREERERRYAFYTDLLHRAGVPEVVYQAVLRSNRGLARFAEAVPVSRTLDEGDVVFLDGQPWQVLHLPGHAGGLIGLYQPQSRLFLSSDHLLRDITSNAVVEPPPVDATRHQPSLWQYLRSLERVRDMDIALVLPGHGPPITDHRTLIEERFAFHQERKARILALLRDGATTAYQVGQRLFGDLPPIDAFLAISEVWGHLEVLQMEGLVTAEDEGGITHWRPVAGASGA